MVRKTETLINGDKSLYSFSNWPDTSVFQTRQYRDARVEAHNAIFWVARAAHSFLKPLPENSHLNLCWDSETHDFKTQIFGDDIQIGLNLSELELYFCEKKEKVPHSFWLDEKTPAFVEAWYLVELLHRGIDPEMFSTTLPFESKDMLMGDTQDHNASLFKKELTALTDCIKNTVPLLEQFADRLKQDNKNACVQQKIVLQPETFTLVLNNTLSGENNQKITAGLSVGDNLRQTPFLFTKAIDQTNFSKNHILDYEPECLISLDTIIEKAFAQNELVNKMYKSVVKN